ncbi:MAG: carbohydrate kinase family protein [Patescibacteria group bacterium]
MKYDVVTFGSAALDVYVISKDNVIKSGGKDGIFLPLGEKIEGKKIVFCSGGGGTNAAATFANQGLKVSFCGMVGKDLAGKFVLEDLEKYRIDREFLLETEKRSTNCSVVFLVGERNIIVPYRGASGIINFRDIPLSRLNAKWFYLAPLSGNLRKDLSKIVSFGKRKGIKIALNPGKYQLTTPGIKEILKEADILILNREEASFLTKMPYQDENKIFRKLNELAKGICIMTKGEGGVTVSDGKFLYKAKVLKTKVVDETGAGDAFSSGFVAEYIKTNNIISAIQFGMANSASNLRKLGAKEGLLEKGQPFKRVKVFYGKL